MSVFAPFRFSPVNSWIYTPKWGDCVSHDVPFEDGLCGEIQLELCAESPLMISGERNTNKDGSTDIFPFRLGENGDYAIPPSSLKGMLRSIVETLTFSRMGPFVDDRRFSIRDLSGTTKPAYVTRLLAQEENKIFPKVKSGWLRKTTDGLEIVECFLSRVEYDEIGKCLNIGTASPPHKNDRGYADFQSLRKKSDIAERYGWLKQPTLLRARLDAAAEEQIHKHQGGRIQISYRKAKLSTQGKYTGHIVLTGHPSDSSPNASGKKHMEFIFHGKRGKRELSERVFEDFISIHQPDDGRPISNAWEFYRDAGYPIDPFEKQLVEGRPFRDGGWMPIFFLEEDEEIVSIGLAFMFKLAQNYSTHQMLGHSSQEHILHETSQPDFASLVFGETADQETAAGLKGRVTFDLAPLSNPPEQLVETRSAILMGPKPSYHPIYVDQPSALGPALPNSGVPYDTYSARKGAKNTSSPRLKGRKIWPASLRAAGSDTSGKAYRADHPPPLPDNINSRSTVSNLHSLPKRSLFSTTLRFHNLKPEELGAVLWALTWGERDRLSNEEKEDDSPPNLMHRLGGGKPLGLGHVSIRMRAANLRTNDMSKEAVDAPDVWGRLEDCLEAFEKHMETQLAAQRDQPAPNGWKQSPQVQSLLAAADPQKNRNLNLTYMELGERSQQNTYVGEKHRDNRGVLPDYLWEIEQSNKSSQ